MQSFTWRYPIVGPFIVVLQSFAHNLVLLRIDRRRKQEIQGVQGVCSAVKCDDPMDLSREGKDRPISTKSEKQNIPMTRLGMDGKVESIELSVMFRAQQKTIV